MILLLFVHFSISFADSLTIKSACNPWPPFIDPEHPKGGLSLEIARAAFETQGYTISHRTLPWARAIQYIKENRIDVIVDTWITEERKKFLRFSIPYLYNRVTFISLKEKPFEYNGLSSLEGLTIGTLRGYGYGDDFNNATTFKREIVNSLKENFNKLQAQRVDLVIADEIVAKTFITESTQHAYEQFHFSSQPLSTNPLYVTSGIGNPRSTEYIEAFNRGLKIIINNGTFDSIMKSYGLEK